MFFSMGSSAKRGKEVIDNLYYFTENQMLDCNQYVIKNPNSDKPILMKKQPGVCPNQEIKQPVGYNYDANLQPSVIRAH